ncbi:MAG TPA: single-stranded DNA-binding protein [Ktedonobacteraceae bacterium]|nr:single-stranded DNA-binding protein [Ktedonobacteraceae bacterium]
MNKIMLIGNLGRDPEMTYTPSGVAVTRFSLAVNHVSKTSTGERQTETEWFNITAWRQLAETCNNYLHKGSKVFIEGRLTQRKYTDRNGVERTSVDVIANDMEMLTPKSAQSSSSDFMAGNIDDLGDLEDHGDDNTPF